jgi:hypothetical protein
MVNLKTLRALSTVDAISVGRDSLLRGMVLVPLGLAVGARQQRIIIEGTARWAARAVCGETGGPRPYPQEVQATQASWRCTSSANGPGCWTSSGQVPLWRLSRSRCNHRLPAHRCPSLSVSPRPAHPAR